MSRQPDRALWLAAVEQALQHLAHALTELDEPSVRLLKAAYSARESVRDARDVLRAISAEQSA